MLAVALVVAITAVSVSTFTGPENGVGPPPAMSAAGALRSAVLGDTVASAGAAAGATLVTTAKTATTRATMVLDARPAGDAVRFDMAGLIDGALAIELRDQGAVVLGAGGAILSTVEAPWAVDATGAAIETFYSVEGTELLQHLVVPDNAVFPIVADPKFTTGWTGLFVRWYRSEAKWMAGLSLTVLAGAVATMCAGPHIVLCGGAVAGIYYILLGVSDWAVDQMYNRGCRLETRLLPWISTYWKC